MSDQRLTRQGVRDLNDLAINASRKEPRFPLHCSHWFLRFHLDGRAVIADRRYESDPDTGSLYLVDVPGKRCMWCGEIREDR